MCAMNATTTTDLSKAHESTTQPTHRVTRSMAYTHPHPPPSRPSAPLANGSTTRGALQLDVAERDRFGYPKSFRSSTSASPSSDSTSSSSSPTSPTASSSSSHACARASPLIVAQPHSAPAPLSHTNVDPQVPSPPSAQPFQYPPTNPIFPLYRHLNFITSRNVRPEVYLNQPPSYPENPESFSPYGFTNGTHPGFAAPSPSSYQHAINQNDQRLRTPQEQLLATHDLPRTLPPLPTLQPGSTYSALQHQYLSMLAEDPQSSYGSMTKSTNLSDLTTSAPAGAASMATLEGLLESGVYPSRCGSEDPELVDRWLTDLDSPRMTSAVAASQAFSAEERSATSSEPLSFDHLFNTQQSSSSSSLPPTPVVHDVSAFTSMNNSLNPALFSNDDMHFNFAGLVDQPMLDVVQKTPPSASEPPALSFSPTSPFSATPGTGLTLMDGEFEGDFEGMPLFGYDDAMSRALFFNDETSVVAPSALGLKGVAAPSASSTQTSAAAAPELDGLISMTDTPSVVPVPLASTTTPSTSTLPMRPSASTTSARPTGHRKNLSPSSLLPVDAPTQHRNYRGPSATSRKDIPAFALAPPSSSSSSTKPSSSKKRKASEEPEEVLDEDDEEEMRTGRVKPRMGESEIEAKRRQNTLAARRSRHRKLEYVRNLENQVRELMDQNEVLVERLRGAGLEP